MTSEDYLKRMIMMAESEQKLIYEISRLEVELLIAQREIQKYHSKTVAPEKVMTIANDSKNEAIRQSSLLQKDEVAQRLNKSTRWVEMQCAKRVIPHIKLGRSVFFNWDDVVSSLEAFSKGGVVRRY
jgi:hypothetical protein